MAFFRQMMQRLALWMSGRNGVDQLAICTLVVTSVMGDSPLRGDTLMVAQAAAAVNC